MATPAGVLRRAGPSGLASCRWASDVPWTRPSQRQWGIAAAGPRAAAWDPLYRAMVLPRMAQPRIGVQRRLYVSPPRKEEQPLSGLSEVPDKTAKTTKTAETVETAETAKETETTTTPPPTKPAAADTADASLPSAAESRRSQLSARFSSFMDTFQERVFVASQALNDLTGYSAIEKIKARNAALETELAAAQTALRTARRDYQAVNERRASTQREVTTLLARKDSWAPGDLERFTALYRRDHELELAAGKAVEELTEAEATESRLSNSLTAGILKRYHEEQVWSDRIRRQSTWGTWGLMGINVVLFIVLQVFAEPWRRRRLMRGIAQAETGVLDDVRRELVEVRTALAAVTTALPAAAAPASVPASEPASAPAAPETPAASESTPLPIHLWSWPDTWSWQDTKTFAADPARWKAWLADLYSERLVRLRMRDLSLIAVESAAAGVAVVGAFALALRR